MNNRFTFRIGILNLLLLCTMGLQAQDDLLSLLEEEETTDYATSSFKTNRVINLHSLENTHSGVLDFKINHRFGMLNQGVYDLFGLDNASMRLGLDYGITKNLQIGLGRSTTCGVPSSTRARTAPPARKGSPRRISTSAGWGRPGAPRR